MKLREMYHYFQLESKVTLGLGGVLIVLLSVGASVGIFGFVGVKGGDSIENLFA